MVIETLELKKVVTELIEKTGNGESILSCIELVEDFYEKHFELSQEKRTTQKLSNVSSFKPVEISEH